MYEKQKQIETDYVLINSFRRRSNEKAELRNDNGEQPMTENTIRLMIYVHLLGTTILDCDVDHSNVLYQSP